MRLLYVKQWSQLRLHPRLHEEVLPVYKIGAGKSSRLATGHGQGPVSWRIVFAWPGMAHKETLLQSRMRRHRVELSGGREWFHLGTSPLETYLLCARELGLPACTERYLDFQRSLSRLGLPQAIVGRSSSTNIFSWKEEERRGGCQQRSPPSVAMIPPGSP